jgi:hypothetical protein
METKEKATERKPFKEGFDRDADRKLAAQVATV